ncbi:MAG: hypothetical protein AVDCRST_MAG73-478 [uncultured Thermomicrobiales bacterium]|uniref:Uncharacterized protein n=1 Tax=uncultured Thermomicrobiales bacterium TaxID=1645740 RepID=A0A6J4TNF1_9BACT|nr:MAG: hypothetical protein AVDCRST_MAG73-478 [uncultured Thermomicrobiales bacterium]
MDGRDREPGQPAADRKELDEKFLAHSLEHYARARSGFSRDVKVAVVLLGLLLVFFFQYIPLAADEVALAGAYDREEAALLDVVDGLERLNRVVTDGGADLADRVTVEIAVAQERVGRLEAFVAALPADPTVAAPAFLAECALPVGPAVPAGGTAEALLRGAAGGPGAEPVLAATVQSCIAGPAAAALTAARATLLADPFAAAKADLEAALDRERAAVERHRGVLNRIGVRANQDDLETRLVTAERLIASRKVVDPAPEDWWRTYAGTPARFASFRDNLLFFFPSRVDLPVQPTPERGAGSGTTPAALRGGATGEEIVPEDFATSIDQIRATLETIGAQEEALRGRMEESVANLRSLLPDYAQPLLAIARPRYIVLGYPVLLAGVSMYLVMSFAVLQRRIGKLRTACQEPPRLSPEVLETCIWGYPATVFAALCSIPLLPIGLSLYAVYDRPELNRAAPTWLYAATVVLFAGFLVVAGLLTYTRRLDGLERNLARRVPWRRAPLRVSVAGGG